MLLSSLLVKDSSHAPSFHLNSQENAIFSLRTSQGQRITCTDTTNQADTLNTAYVYKMPTALIIHPN